MKESVKNYVISHKTGTKANQIEEFDFGKLNTLTLGRNPSCTVQFDSDMDTMVSREHAKITKTSEDPLTFNLEDTSKNGVWINGHKVVGSSEIHAGDLIELGQGGPSFVFDLDPRPGDMLAETQLISIDKATQEIGTSNEGIPQKTSIGKQTFERVIAAEQKKSNKKLIAGLAAALLVIGALSYVFWNNSKSTSREIQSQKTQQALNDSITRAEHKAEMDALLVKLDEGKPLSTVEIAALNEDRVVRIEATWQLYDSKTNDEVYHKYVRIEGQDQPIATYIQNAQGQIEPYLVGKSKASPDDIPLGSSHLGSGFIISEDGFVLTNRHVASAWHTRFQYGPYAFPGVLIDQNGKVRPDIIIQQQNAFSWVPSEATMLEGKPITQKLYGDNTVLNVVFANDDQRRNATVEAISNKHDVAMMKISMPIKHSFVELLDNYDEIKTGQQVTVIGYPGVAPDVYSIQRSSDVFKQGVEASTIPIPTVTPGTVGRLIKASPENQRIYSIFGDAYQLTINATGAGNSGGPLFDEKGRVIGLYFAGAKDPSGTQISFALPIKYGLELMGHKDVIN